MLEGLLARGHSAHPQRKRRRGPRSVVREGRSGAAGAAGRAVGVEAEAPVMPRRLARRPVMQVVVLATDQSLMGRATARKRAVQAR